MTTVARRIASVPRRTSGETWRRIIELISTDGSSAREELVSITSIAAMLIAEEYSRSFPITVSGGGPQVRIYTLHEMQAIEHDLEDEAKLAFNPTESDHWTLLLPASGSDLEAAKTALEGQAHISVGDMTPSQESLKADAHGSGVTLDLRELER